MDENVKIILGGIIVAAAFGVIGTVGYSDGQANLKDAPKTGYKVIDGVSTPSPVISEVCNAIRVSGDPVATKTLRETLRTLQGGCFNTLAGPR